MSSSTRHFLLIAPLLVPLLLCSLCLAQKTAARQELLPGRTFPCADPRLLCFSAGDASLACSDVLGHITVFDLKTGETVWSWEHPEVLETSAGNFVYPRAAAAVQENVAEVSPGWMGNTVVSCPPHDLQWMAVAHNSSTPTPVEVVEENVRTLKPEGWRFGSRFHLYEGPDLEHAASVELEKPERLSLRGTKVLLNIQALEFSPLEPLLAIADTYGYLSLYWAPDHSLVRRQRGDSMAMSAIAFNPRGDRLATIGRSGIVRLWAVEGLELLAELEGHKQRKALGLGDLWISFSPDGSRFASAAMDGTLRVWDVEDEGHDKCFTLPPELGERPLFAFASGSDWVYAVGSVRLGNGYATAFGRLDLNTGAFVLLQDLPNRLVSYMVCSPTRNYLAMADVKNQEILTWHIWPPSPTNH